MLCLTIAPGEYIDIGDHARLRFVGFMGEAARFTLTDRRNGVVVEQTIALEKHTPLRMPADVLMVAVRSSRGQVGLGFSAPRSIGIHRMRRQTSRTMEARLRARRRWEEGAAP